MELRVYVAFLTVVVLLLLMVVTLMILGVIRPRSDLDCRVSYMERSEHRHALQERVVETETHYAYDHAHKQYVVTGTGVTDPAIHTPFETETIQLECVN